MKVGISECLFQRKLIYTSFSENATEKEKKDLLSELEVMKILEPHPNVVTLLGCCSDKGNLKFYYQLLMFMFLF